MNTIRKFVYAALLAVTSLHFAPTQATAQESAHGNFTLTHEVHWQNAVVPAGRYRFSLDGDGAAGLLTLIKLSGPRTGFLFMVHDQDEAQLSKVNQIVLETTPEGSYVSAMQLPEFGVTLHFPVPAKAAEKQMAKVGTTTMASAQ
jgi:hypothetical protein